MRCGASGSGVEAGLVSLGRNISDVLETLYYVAFQHVHSGGPIDRKVLCSLAWTLESLFAEASPRDSPTLECSPVLQRTMPREST